MFLLRNQFKIMELLFRHLGITLLYLLTIFDSYGQLAPTSASVPVKQFNLGDFHTYSYESTVLLNEAKSSINSVYAKDVGYQISAQIQVASVWQNSFEPAEKILQIKLMSPVLHIKSRKAPSPEGFVSHKSQLESMTNEAFLVHWNAGMVENVYVGEAEERSMVNLKRGIASMFQFKTFDIEVKEIDVSGTCSVQYTTSDGHTFLKTKTNCSPHKGTPSLTHPDKVFGSVVNARREAKFTLKHDLSVLESVETSEYHEMTVALRKEAGGSVQAIQELKITDSPGNAKPLKADSVEAAVKQIEKNLGVTFKKQDLVLEQEPQICQEECPSFSKLVKENRKNLEASNLGTLKSASSFIKLLNAARSAKKEEFAKVLKSSSNFEILPQLLDLAATAQTLASHGAAMKVLDFTSEIEIDLPERYLWSLSLGSHPLETVIRDILNKSEIGVPNAKLSETLTLTAAGMTNKWLRLPGNTKKKLKDDVKNSILRRLNECKADEECKQPFIRAIKNLGLPDLIPSLIELIKNGNKKTTIAAMKSLHGLPSQFWDEKVRDLCRRVFLQIRRRYDSSARTLAADILLEVGPTYEELFEMIEALRHAVTRDSQEVGQYVLQRIRQIGEKNKDLNNLFRQIILANSGKFNGYHVLAQRGMASAFSRDFLNTASSNGSLVSTLELASGLMKRSTLDVVLEGTEASEAIFTLGMFAGGLGSFVSSDDGEAPAPEEDESATAGMELTVLGVNVRPFVFFNGQGELMGLVWSGAGSERTPAFQALIPLQDHMQVVALQNGFVAEISLLGGMSFDLAGEIQLSLWNRNAHSVVEKNAGVALQGLIKVDSSFVRSQVEFTIATEQKLNLVSDVNFYSTVALCLQLRQPDSIVKHNIHKIERISGSKHRLRKSKYKVFHVPGKTYALNKKNNEMCNALFQE